MKIEENGVRKTRETLELKTPIFNLDLSEIVYEEIQKKTAWEKALWDWSYNSVTPKALPLLCHFVAMLETQQMKQIVLSKWQLRTGIFISQISHMYRTACSNRFGKRTKTSYHVLPLSDCKIVLVFLLLFLTKLVSIISSF